MKRREASPSKRKERRAREKTSRRAVKRSEKLRLRLYDRRSCGECRACCTTMRIDVEPDEQAAFGVAPEDRRSDAAFVKPVGEACPNLNLTSLSEPGCRVYAERPRACREWACVWRSGSDLLEEDERPDRIGLVLDTVRREGLAFPFLRGDVVEGNSWWPVIAERISARGHLLVIPTAIGSDECTLMGPDWKREAFKTWSLTDRAKPRDPPPRLPR